jgi:outer membrane protein assembly factor BamA
LILRRQGGKIGQVWRAVAALLALMVAAPAWAQNPDDDDPKSSISEWPPKPKPPAKPPAPSPKPNAPATPNAPPPTTPNAPANDAPPSGSAGASDGSPPGAGATPAAPGQKPVKPPSPTEPRSLVPPSPNAEDPASSSMTTLPVPAGKSVNDVEPPRRMVTSDAKGIGQPITDIKIVDNTRTDRATIEYIAGIKRGEVLTMDLVDTARVRLLTSGLFKDVNLYWEQSVPGVEAGVRLVISARDKLSWIIAPIFSYSTGDYGGGIAYANSNVLGANKKFLAVAQYTTAEKLLFVAFLDPQIKNTRFYYRVDLLLRRDSIWEYAAGHTGNPLIERATDLDTIGGGVLGGVNFTRHFHLDLRLKIYYDNVHASSCYNTTNADGSGTPDVVAEQGGVCRQPASSGWDNTLTTTVGYDGRSNVYGVLHGLNINAIWQYGPRWLGQRFDYHLLSTAGGYAWRFFKEHNLLLKLGADVFFDPPFKLEVETGGALMRGFLFRQYRGDTDVRATLEYILPLFTVYGLSVRMIGFYDTNLTWFRGLPPQNGPLSRFIVRGDGFRDFLPDTPSGVVRDSWHNGIGGGIRLYLRGVILPLLGVDAAYGFEAQNYRIYLSVGSTLD